MNVEENEQATDAVTPGKEIEGGTSKTVREKMEYDKAGEKVTEARDITDRGDPNTSIVKEEETLAKGTLFVVFIMDP